MRIGDTLKKAAGLFVEFPEEDHSLDMPRSTAPEDPAPPARTVEEIVRESPGPNLDEIKVPENTPAPTVAEEGHFDFNQIYRQANLPVSPYTAEQVLDLISGLPSELSIETKRQTVKVTLNAMASTLGVNTEMIVADASRKLAALAAFSEHYAKQAASFSANAENEIASLQAQIEAKKQAISAAKVQQAHMAQMCHSESDRLDDVLEFFSLDVAPSKYAGEASKPSG